MAALYSKVDPASASFLGCPVIFLFRLSSAQSLEGFVETFFPCPHFWRSLCEKVCEYVWSGVGGRGGTQVVHATSLCVWGSSGVYANVPVHIALQSKAGLLFLNPCLWQIPYLPVTVKSDSNCKSLLKYAYHFLGLIQVSGCSQSLTNFKNYNYVAFPVSFRG